VNSDPDATPSARKGGALGATQRDQYRERGTKNFKAVHRSASRL